MLLVPMGFMGESLVGNLRGRRRQAFFWAARLLFLRRIQILSFTRLALLSSGFTPCHPGLGLSGFRPANPLDLPQQTSQSGDVGEYVGECKEGTLPTDSSYVQLVAVYSTLLSRRVYRGSNALYCQGGAQHLSGPG
jgi:hypothetical protein